jgi:hypothetical protein
MEECFFRDISENRCRRGVFTNVPELTAPIEQYAAHHNANLKPFIWTATAHFGFARQILQQHIQLSYSPRKSENKN